MVAWLRRKTVPFPRGEVNLPRLDETLMAGEQDLLLHYRSQLAMLRGSEPAAMLRALRQSCSEEGTIGISRALAPAGA